ncbi:NAC domain containing protein [Parasponia andersonii]|uniref:NAC domain containing protein n=1 Tax=Parasponia andersonii TaxID=3476 RepID=A0A2P5BL25_PARAD|nr:NAC domain containing protein [Parasponia andersonii]
MSSNDASGGMFLAVGMRFCPTDEEVIGHYLRLKDLERDSEVDPYIAQVDICDWDPWELPCKSKLKSNDNEWWFSSRRYHLNSKSNQFVRKTKTGSWKSTGEEKTIKAKGRSGRKRYLTFHERSSPRKRTGWTLHEYYYPALHGQRPNCAICRLKYDPHKKGRKADTRTPDSNESEPSGEITSDLESSVVSAAIPAVQCYDKEEVQSISQPQSSPDSCSLETARRILLDDEMQAPPGADKSNKYYTEFSSLLNVSPEENNCGATTDNLFNTSSLTASSMGSYLDGPFRSESDSLGDELMSSIGYWKFNS